MFQWNMNFRVPEQKSLIIKDFTTWLYSNWVDENLVPNTLKNLENFDYNDTGSLMSRKGIGYWLWIYSLEW